MFKKIIKFEIPMNLYKKTIKNEKKILKYCILKSPRVVIKNFPFYNILLYKVLLNKIKLI